MFLDKDLFEDYLTAIDDMDIDAAKEILLSNIPDNRLIYRYCRGLKRDLNNLTNNKMWLSSVFNFNDPYDCAVMVNCGFKLQYNHDEIKKAFEDYEKQQCANLDSEKIRKKIFVASFSEINNSFPMWGYYAAEHKGICISYNLKELIKKYNCFPVIYSDKLIVHSEKQKKNLLRLSLTKSIEWNHEQEWRIVKIDNSNSGKNGMVISDFAKPVEIFIGCRQEEAVKCNVEMKDTNIAEDKLYASLGDIMDYVEQNDVQLYMPMISINEYKLIDRAVKLNK